MHCREADLQSAGFVILAHKCVGFNLCLAFQRINKLHEPSALIQCSMDSSRFSTLIASNVVKSMVPRFHPFTYAVLNGGKRPPWRAIPNGQPHTE